MHKSNSPRKVRVIRLRYPLINAAVKTLLMGVPFLLGSTASENISATTINSSTSPVVLQTLDPTTNTFVVPSATTITVNTGNAIAGDNSKNWQLTNSGTITQNTQSTGIAAIQLNSAITNAATVENFGTIVSTANSSLGVAGIRLLNGGTIINHSGASLSSAGFYGIYSDSGFATVINDGAISGSAAGMRFLTGGGVTQSATGTISSSASPGIFIDAGPLTISNAGSITSTGGAPGILARSTSTGIIANSGLISGSIGVQITNTSGNGVALTNTGTITGTDGTAVSIGGSNNTLTLGTGSVLNGSAAVTSGTNNNLVLQGTGSASNALTGFTGLTMSGTSWLLSGNVSTTGTTTAATTLQSGTLTVTGTLNNSGSGGGTNINSGAALKIGNGKATGSVSGDIAVNSGGTLTFNRSDDVTYANVISGNGSLTQAGTGTLALTGSNTYAGGTTISAGSLQIGNGGTTGSITGDVTNNGALVFNRSNVLTVGGAVSGTGSLTQTGTGTTTLTGAGSSVASANVTAGTLNLAQPGALTITGNYTTGSGATTQIAADSTLAVGGAFTQAAGSTLNVEIGSTQPVIAATSANLAGTLNITGFTAPTPPTSASALTATEFNVIHTTGRITNDFTSVTVGGSSSPVDYLTLTEGKSANGLDYNVGLGLTWFAGATQGNGVFTLANSTDAFNVDVALSDQPASSVPWNGTTLTKNGAGTLTLSAANTYTGGTTINAGTLQIGSGGTTGSVIGNITDNAALAFNRSDTATYDGVVSGTGSLTQAGTGTLILTGDNTYTGATTISAGTLQLGNGGTTGSVASNITDNAALVFNHSDSVFFANIISGTGSVTQDGTGKLVFNGVQTYSGNTNINSGTLAIGDAAHTNANLAGGGLVTVGAAGALGGYGSVAGSVVNNGLIGVGNALPVFANGPDASFTIAGNLNNSGTLTMANGTAGDRMIVGGTYTSNGGRLLVNTVLNEGGSASSSDLLVAGATALGTKGATQLVVNNLGGAGAPSVDNGIMVVQVQDPTHSAADAFVLSGRAVAGPYEYQLLQGGAQNADGNWYLRSELEPTPPTPPDPPTPPNPPQPLFRPEVAAYLANQRVAAEMFVHSLDDRASGTSQSAANADGSSRPGSVWLRMEGRNEGSNSSDGTFHVNTDSFLMQGGVEVAQKKLTPGADLLHLGLMATYETAQSNAEAAGNPATARGNVAGYSIGAYGTWYQNDASRLGAYADTWVQYGWFNNSVVGEDLPTVNYNAHGWAISGESGYAFALINDWVFEPQGQLIYADYREDSLAELNGTHVNGADSSGVITRLGLRLQRTFQRSANKTMQFYATVNWWHTSTDSSISFNQIPVGSLYPENRYEVKLGLNGDLGKNWSAWSNVSGVWGAQSYHAYVVRAGVKYAW